MLFWIGKAKTKRSAYILWTRKQGQMAKIHKYINICNVGWKISAQDCIPRWKISNTNGKSTQVCNLKCFVTCIRAFKSSNTYTGNLFPWYLPLYTLHYFRNAYRKHSRYDLKYIWKFLWLKPLCKNNQKHARKLGNNSRWLQWM